MFKKGQLEFGFNCLFCLSFNFATLIERQTKGIGNKELGFSSIYFY